MRAAETTLIIGAALLALAGVSHAGAHPEGIEDCFATFPSSFSSESNGAQSYRLDYRFYNRDVTGAARNSIYITGSYTRGLENGRMRWNDVRIASAAGSDVAMPPGSRLAEMEGFEYGLSDEIIREPLYERFPNEDIKHLAKTMVWDGAMIEAFNLLSGSFAGLRPNEFQPVTEYEDFDVRMGAWGSLKMQGLRVKWSGISVMRGEPCAVVLYQSFANPVDAGPIRGRSCYWGQFWISREDGEIECLTLNEDVILEMPTGESTSTITNMQREVRFEKTS